MPQRARYLLLAITIVLAAASLCTSAEAEIPDHGTIGRPFQLPPDLDWADGYGFTTPQPGEPTTVGSGSPCSDPDYAFGSSWEFTRTVWESFTGDGGPVIVGLYGGMAMAVYETEHYGVPTASDRLACFGPFYFSHYEFMTRPGHDYLVQLGDQSPDPSAPVGSWNLIASSPTLSDERTDADALPLDVPIKVSNFGASVDYGESLKCSPYSGRSVWMRTAVPWPGSLHIELHSAMVTTVGAYLSVYAGDSSTPIACNVDPDSNADPHLDVPVVAGTYYVQVTAPGDTIGDPNAMEGWWTANAHLTSNPDVDGDGYSRPTDCNDADPSIHPGALDIPEDGFDQDCSGSDAVNFDRDGDSYQRPSDCNDGNPTIHPGAIDRPDDHIDQNCDRRDNHKDSDRDGIPDFKDHCPRRSNGGIDADHNGCRDPIQLLVTVQISTGPALVSTAQGSPMLRLTMLRVRSAPGVHITVTCGQHACRREETTLHKTVAKMGSTFASHFAVGTVVTIAATKPGTIGMVKRYRLLASGAPARQWCTRVGRPRSHIRCN